MIKKFSLKDLLFNQDKIAKISEEISEAYPLFKKKSFVTKVVAKFPELELKARISWISECLKQYLPDNYHEAVNIIIQALPAPNNPKLFDNDFGDFIYAPYAEYIAKNGCNKKDLFFSLNALREITKRFSAEDAIRYFINDFPTETLSELQKWSKDDNYHVRRLCSEGSRPKLPWSQKINIAVTTPISILDNLFYDRTRYVTRSVANHINDISKTDPDVSINTLLAWEKSGKQNIKEMDYIIRHSLRSLIKQGNIKAMELLGVACNPDIEFYDFKVLEIIKINNALEFSFTIKANEDVKIIADYVISFPNQSGTITSSKVFKIKNFSLSKDNSLTITKRHMFRANMTTRKIFPGQYEIKIQINGKFYGKKLFVVR